MIISMISFQKRTLIITAVLFSLVVCIQAEEGSKDEKKSYSSSTSFSLLMTSGNSQDFSLGLDTEQNLELNKNHIQFKGSIIYSESDGSKDSELYYSHLEYKRTFSSKVYILGFGRIERNVLAGYNYRLALSGGGGYFWIKSEKFELTSEVAIGLSRENNISKNNEPDITLSFASCLISSSLKIKISSNSEFIYQERFFLNLDNTEDYRLTSLSSISTNISSHLALKISYQLKYNHLPVPGFKSTDHYLLSSLVLNF